MALGFREGLPYGFHFSRRVLQEFRANGCRGIQGLSRALGICRLLLPSTLNRCLGHACSRFCDSRVRFFASHTGLICAD